MTTGAIEGRVLDKQTKEPLVGVTVVATGATPEPQSALTDVDGIYKITDLLPGAYAVTFYVESLVVTRTGIRVGANSQVTVNQALALTGTGILMIAGYSYRQTRRRASRSKRASHKAATVTLNR